MLKLFKKKLNNKKEGISDFIASLIVLAFLTLFCYYFINVIADVDTKIQIDQVARKYILRMESSGELTAAEVNDIKADLMSIKAVAATGQTPVVTWKGASEGAKSGYGGTITLTIDCPVTTIKYSTDVDDEGNHKSLLGVLTRDNIVTMHVTKQSTAKY